MGHRLGEAAEVRTLLILAVTVIAGLTGFLAWRESRTNATIQRLEARNDSLIAVAGKVDTIYATDTVRLTRTRVLTDSVFTTLTDTLVHRDTVVRYILAERQACDKVIATCEDRVAVRDQRILVLDSLIAAERKKGPDWKLILGSLAAGAAVGFVAGK